MKKHQISGTYPCTYVPSHTFVPLRYLVLRFAVQLLDIDKRFSTYKDDFVCYDFNLPILSQIPKEWKNTFDLVILDPPFLSEDCFIKCALTATFLSKQKIIVCTGKQMCTHMSDILTILTIYLLHSLFSPCRCCNGVLRETHVKRKQNTVRTETQK